MTTVRSFVAIELNEPARQALAVLQRDLQSAVPVRTVRWTDPRSIHLTLQFLGDVPLDQIPAITSALRIVSQRVRPFAFDLAGLGAFPDRRRPRIVWVGVREASGVLAALQRRVGEALTPLGFPPEARAFSPHVTIGRAARDASPRDLSAVGEHVTGTAIGIIARVDVDHITLMRSDLRPGGSVYTAQAELGLGAA
jgi:2'-5' RNA ligase